MTTATGQADYGDISQRTALWAMVEMLEHNAPVVILQKFAAIKPMPKNKADNAKFRRAIPFAVSTTPLVEGVTPSQDVIAYEDVPVQLEQYGGLAGLTDKIADVSEDPVLKDMMELSGEQSAATMEAITWGVIKAGTSVFYANGSVRTSVNTVLTKRLQQKIVRSLKAQKAKKLRKVMSASVKIDTHPIEAAYIAVAHTDVESDIRALASFVPVAKYGTMNTICAEEIGSVDDVRYVLSPDLDPYQDAGGAKGTTFSTSGTLSDVYPIIFIGRDSYGVVPLKGMEAIVPVVINPDKKTKDDPLGQRGFVGWKAWFAVVILNQTWMTRAEVAIDALD